MVSNEFFRKFERKFSQLSSSKRLLLDIRKTKLFLQAANEAIEDMLFVLLVDKSIKRGLSNDWKRIKDMVLLVIKQQQIKIIGRNLKHKALSPMMPIIPLSLVTSIPIQEACKIFFKDTLKELVKNMRELRIKMNK